MQLDIDEIQKYLPHRYPFLLVDRITSLELGEVNKIVGYKNITFNEPQFQGHFPQMKVFPGVMIIEAMAQVAGVLGFNMANKTPEDGSIYMLTGIDNVRFRQPVVPGDQLRLEAEFVSEKRNIWKFKTTAYVGDKKVANADVLCVDKEV